jgi:hypothetical protein
MKDRITRKNVKKPSHRLFRAMISISAFTVLSAVAFSIVVVNLTNENNSLNQKIENYTVQIDMLNDLDNQTYTKNQVQSQDK